MVGLREPTSSQILLMSSSSSRGDRSDETLSLPPGDSTLTLTVDGRERKYLVRNPLGADDTSPKPVVFVFHGGGTNANWLRRFCGLSDKADRAGFLAVFPSGTGVRARRLSWNCPGSGFERWWGEEGAASGETPPDEPGFVRAMLDDLQQRTAIDRRRVYACGVSTGAILVYYLAAVMSDEIAAIAPVGGPIGEYRQAPSRPMPIIHFHGTDDEFAPYPGGKGPRSFTGLDFNSVEETIATWVAFNGCDPTPEEQTLAQVKDQQLRVVKSRYQGSDPHSEIVLYTIHNGGHTWPGQDPRMELMGKFSEDLIANDVIWEFFSRHPLP